MAYFVKICCSTSWCILVSIVFMAYFVKICCSTSWCILESIVFMAYFVKICCSTSWCILSIVFMAYFVKICCSTSWCILSIVFMAYFVKICCSTSWCILSIVFMAYFVHGVYWGLHGTVGPVLIASITRNQKNRRKKNTQLLITCPLGNSQSLESQSGLYSAIRNCLTTQSKPDLRYIGESSVIFV